MKISFITDEFTQNLDEAITFALDNGLQGVELRSVDDRALQDFSLEEISGWKKKLDAAGLEVSNLASSFFKCSFEPGQIEMQLRRLEKLCDIADILACRTLRGFSFFREDTVSLERLAAAFEPALTILQKRDKLLLLEADPSVYTTNHRTVAELLRLLGSDHAAAVYDPGNCLFDPLGEKPFPDAYEAIRPYLRHVHIKDAVYEKGEPVCLAPGSGLVDFPTVLRRLRDDSYNGYVSLEPHYRATLTLTEAQMRTPSGAEFSRGGQEAMQQSANALKRMLGAR